METLDYPVNLRLKGKLVCGSIALPEESVTDAAVATAAGIQASKLQHQRAVSHRQLTGTAVVSQTEDLYVVRGRTGLLLSLDVVVTTAPVGTGAPGTDRKLTVDVQKGNQGAGFATLLTAPVTIDNTIAARQVVAGSLVANPALADGDTIRVVVTVSGTTGTQAQGLVATLNVREDADP